MKFVTVDAQSVVVKDRIRKDLGATDGPESIMGLADSLENRGQIQPIVLNGMELKAGGRRLAAAMFLFARGSSIGAKLDDGDVRKLDPGHILAIQYQDLSREDQLAIEIEENTRRKAFSKAEDAVAIKRLQELLGEKGQLDGSLQEGQKVHVRQVAKAAGVSPATVTMGLRVAEAVEKGNKGLLGANSISGAYNKLLSQEKLQARVAQINNSIPTEQLSKNIFNKKAEEWLPTLPNGSVDLWSFDPPWGIGVDSYDRQQKYDGDWSDERDYSKKLIEFCVPHLYRTLKDDSWMFSFFGIQFYDEFSKLLQKVGFKVYPVPYIWYKPNKVGAQNDPSRFDMNQYEPILLVAKGEPRIFKQAQGNVLVHDMPTQHTDRFHFAQKPVALYADLIERFSFGGMCVADPTAGSLAVVKAAKKLGRQYMACEANKENYDRGIIFINEP